MPPLKKTTNEISSSSCVDRISDLPKNVIDLILEKLEIWDVVRTSVLSKKWKQSWTSLPQLIFSDQFTHRYNECFESVICRVLFQHIGPIPKFSLTLHPDMPNHWNMINPWLCFLSTKGVRDLTLDNKYDPFSGDDVELLILPSSFLSCPELRVLWLGACLLKIPFAFNGFKSLTSFTCKFVTFDGLCFGSVISLCPLLQELTLGNCNGLERVLSVVAPNLRVFVIDDFCDIEYITFKNTQNLSSVSILLQFEDMPAKEGKRSYISEFFSCLCNLETLSLRGAYIIPKLASGVVPKRLPSLLNFLKDLKFGQIDFCNSDMVSCLFCIIRSSPNLQLLDIWAYPPMEWDSSPSEDDDEAHILSYLEQQLDFLDFSLDHLHTIKMDHICGAPSEMLIIKFLLAVSPYLKNMKIRTDYSCVAEKVLSISKELLMFRRKSPDVQVTLI